MKAFRLDHSTEIEVDYMKTTWINNKEYFRTLKELDAWAEDNADIIDAIVEITVDKDFKFLNYS